MATTGQAAVPETQQDSTTIASPTRWEFLRDLVVFQLKLAMDGLRDLLLSPISITAGLLGLMIRPREPGYYFYRVLMLGRRTERYINLFGAADNDPATRGDVDEANVDVFVSHVEDMVKKQYEKGGMTANTKDAIDRAIDKMHGRREPGAAPD